MNIGALYLREVRSWRHRFWWLPLAGLLVTMLPLALIPLPHREVRERSWEEMAYPSFLWPAVPQQAMAIVIAALMVVTFLLAMWLARELRGAEVRNNTLPDLAVTTVTAFELAVAQVAAAWTIAAMPIIGALPALVPFGARVGRNAGELALGVAVLLLFPLTGAAIGYALFWWKGLIVIASRGRSFRLWLIAVAILAATVAGTIARPLTIPWWRAMSQSTRAGRGWGDWNQPGPYSSEMLIANFVLGVWLMAALWLLAAFVLTLWERGRRARVALCVLLALAAGLASSHPSALRLRQPTTDRALALGKRLVPVTVAGWGPRHLIDSYLQRPDIHARLMPLLPLVAAGTLFGAEVRPDSDRGLSAQRARWDQAVPLMLAVSGLFYLTCALSAFCFALRDASWVLRRPWVIEALRRPEIAPSMLGRARKPRAGNYVFATRNPFFDYALTRSGGSRVVLFALFGAALCGATLLRFQAWDQFVNQQPTPDPDSGSDVAVLIAALVFLCWLCGVNGGLSIAHLKSSQQWWAMLGLPVRARTILWGLWLPRCVDACVIVVASIAALVMLLSVGHGERSSSSGAEALWLVPACFGGLAGVVLLGVCTSTFAASWSRGPTQATILAVILSIVIGIVLPIALNAYCDWRLGHGQSEEWRLYFTPAEESNSTSRLVALIAAPVLASVFLYAWGVRRLKRSGA